MTVNTVLPGPTASEGVGTFVQQMADAKGIDFAAMEKEFFTSARPSSLLRRFATADEVAAMIVYVCSARASATTGAALQGGWWGGPVDPVAQWACADGAQNASTWGSRRRQRPASR